MGRDDMDKNGGEENGKKRVSGERNEGSAETEVDVVQFWDDLDPMTCHQEEVLSSRCLQVMT